jgi:HAD superfamily hydrolase (TIGR01509 family)
VIDGGRPQALIFDFNGTLSDDESIMYRVFADLFAEHGRPLTQQEYLDELAGHTDEQIVTTWLGDDVDVDAIVAERISRYIRSVAGTDTIADDVRRGVLYAASRVPVLIVSGAAHAEIEAVLTATGLADAVTAVISSDTVTDGKPHPEGYLRALTVLRDRGVEAAPSEVVAFEDTEAGVASAKAAGVRCIAVAGTLPAERLAAADSIVPSLGESLIRELLDER